MQRVFDDFRVERPANRAEKSVGAQPVGKFASQGGTHVNYVQRKESQGGKQIGGQNKDAES